MDELRTQTGALIVEVFWVDTDRQAAGLLVKDSRGTTWADVYGRDDLPAWVWAELRPLAAVVIEGGEAHSTAR